MIYANGTVKRFNYMGLLVKVTDAKGFTTTLSYDDNYNIASITSPAGKAYSFSYTADGYVSAVTLPNGKQLTYGYDNENNLVTYKDAAGNTTSYAYNAQHQMTKWSDANGDVVNTNEYDSEGRVTKQIDGNGNVTQLVYGDHTTTTTDAIVKKQSTNYSMIYTLSFIYAIIHISRDDSTWVLRMHNLASVRKNQFGITTNCVVALR